MEVENRLNQGVKTSTDLDNLFDMKGLEELKKMLRGE